MKIRMRVPGISKIKEKILPKKEEKDVVDFTVEIKLLDDAATIINQLIDSLKAKNEHK